MGRPAPFLPAIPTAAISATALLLLIWGGVKRHGPGTAVNFWGETEHTARRRHCYLTSRFRSVWVVDLIRAAFSGRNLPSGQEKTSKSFSCWVRPGAGKQRGR